MEGFPPPVGTGDSNVSKDTPAAVLRPTVYGSPTTFGSQPWWTSRGWWKACEQAEANDVRADVGTHGPLAIGAVSIRGNKHRLQGVPNQDAFAIGLQRHDADAAEPRSDEFAVLVVSDGMGSAEYSHFSARLVAHHMAAMLREFGGRQSLATLAAKLQEFQRPLLDELTRRVTSYRKDEFQAPPLGEVPTDLTQLQCTVSFAVIPKLADATGRRTVLLGFVGDSPAFILRGGHWLPIEPAKTGEGLWSSSTEGVLGAESMLITEVELVPGDALVVTSDGVGNFLTFNGAPTALGSDVGQRWGSPVGLHELIRDVSFELQSADDDRTVMVLWQRDEV